MTPLSQRTLDLIEARGLRVPKTTRANAVYVGVRQYVGVREDAITRSAEMDEVGE